MTEEPEFFNFTTDVFDRRAAEQPETPALWWVDDDASDHGLDAVRVQFLKL